MDPIARWLRTRPANTLDALLALLVTVLGIAGTATQPTSPGDRHADLLAYALAAVAGVALVWRRRRPGRVFGLTLAVSTVFAARGYPGGPALISLIVSIYTAASLDTRWRSLALGVITALALGGARVIFTAETAGKIAGSAVAFIGGALFLGWAVGNRRAYVAEIRDRAERAERTREEEARRQVDAERLRIARELHDVVAHSIATINVQAGVAAHVIDRQPEQAAEGLLTIKRLSKDALAELRAILDLLRAVDEAGSRQPTAGLVRLDGLLQRNRQAGLEITLDTRGEPRALPVAADLAAYRILQESLTNVLRHAPGAATQVVLDYRTQGLALEVRNGAVSSDASPAFTDGGGHGLLGMRERAESLGGTFNAAPRADGGFDVIAMLPTDPGRRP